MSENNIDNDSVRAINQEFLDRLTGIAEMSPEEKALVEGTSEYIRFKIRARPPGNRELLKAHDDFKKSQC